MEDLTDASLWIRTLEYLCYNHIPISVHQFLIFREPKKEGEDFGLSGRRYKCCGKIVGSPKLKLPTIIYLQRGSKILALIVYENGKVIKFGKSRIISKTDVERVMNRIHAPFREMQTVELIPELDEFPNMKIFLSIMKVVTGMELDTPMKIQSELCFANEIDLVTGSALETINERIKRLVRDGIIISKNG
jgi:hypothetical protein